MSHTAKKPTTQITMMMILTLSLSVLTSACADIEGGEGQLSGTEKTGSFSSGGLSFMSPTAEGQAVPNPVELRAQVPAGTNYVVYSADGYVLGVSSDPSASFAISYEFSQTGYRQVIARAFNAYDQQVGEAGRGMVVSGDGAAQPSPPTPSPEQPAPTPPPPAPEQEQPAPTPPPPPAPAPQQSSSNRAQIASDILSAHRSARLTLWDQTFGRFDGADPLSNIQDTAHDRSAKTSCYGRAPCSSVTLQLSLLNAMRTLRTQYGYQYFVTSIAGADHSHGSLHFSGRAFDIDEINGQRIYGDSAIAREFMQVCRQLGAVEVFGPSNDPSGHYDHIHCGF